ncbi:MAG: T9SS type A sorting domain-containing protein, partial [Peptococcaceae bacterium]|nr:T9SS type A sorting domain-containing protein [Peptococcaceae bacterium]
NFTLDASITGIISPNNMRYYSRYNPICGNPVVIIENTGTTNLTSATITYGVQGGIPQTYNWSGSLAFLQSDTVTLPELTSWAGPAKCFQATISQPNGGVDQNPLNNSYVSYYNTPPDYMANKLAFELKTNNYAAYYTDTLKDSKGNVIFARPASGLLSNSTLYSDTVTLDTGCYVYCLYSLPDPFFPPGAFGLSCPFYSVGSPYDKIVNTGTNSTLVTFNNWYGRQIYWPFTVNEVLSVPELERAGTAAIYPNPSGGLFNLQVSLPGAEDITVKVENILGAAILEKSYRKVSQSLLQLDLSNQPDGVYIINIISNRGYMVKKVILQR